MCIFVRMLLGMSNRNNSEVDSLAHRSETPGGRLNSGCRRRWTREGCGHFLGLSASRSPPPLLPHSRCRQASQIPEGTAFPSVFIQSSGLCFDRLLGHKSRTGGLDESIAGGGGRCQRWGSVSTGVVPWAPAKLGRGKWNQGCKCHLDNEVHLFSCEVRVAGTDHLKLFSN